MIQDKLLQFSEEQDLQTIDDTTVVSTNVIDLGLEHDIGPGNPVGVACTVTTSFAGGTSVQVILQTSTAANMASPVTLLTSPVIVIASLTAGDFLDLGTIPSTTNRYLRVSYTGIGTFTAGAMTTQLTDIKQASYKNA